MDKEAEMCGPSLLLPLESSSEVSRRDMHIVSTVLVFFDWKGRFEQIPWNVAVCPTRHWVTDGRGFHFFGRSISPQASKGVICSGISKA